MPTPDFSVELRKWDAVFKLRSVAEVTVSSYDLPAKAGMEQGGKEVEFILNKRPNENIITVPLEVTNLRLFYQPALTEEFKEADCEIWTATHVKTKSGGEYWRPENVVGSYAVYHAFKRGKEYRTGKAFHIYRPQLIDAEGKKAWAEFNRDADATKQFVITMPQKFLDEAVYPVVVDPTFGYVTIGGSDYSYPSNSYVFGLKAVLWESGTLTKITAYIKSDNAGNWKTAIYDYSGSSPANLLAVSDAVNVGKSYNWVDFSISQALTATTYHLAFYADSPTTNTNIKYDSGDLGISKYVAVAGGYPSFPDPFGSASGTSSMLSIYATYTTESGPIVQTVTDLLSLSDSALRHKALLLISDSAALAEAFSRGKTFTLVDALNLAETERVLKGLVVHDASSLADATSTPTRVVKIAENVSFADFVQVGAGGAKKSKLFLILGDVALQLTGD